jgi:hypothetical protein
MIQMLRRLALSVLFLIVAAFLLWRVIVRLGDGDPMSALVLAFGATVFVGALPRLYTPRPARSRRSRGRLGVLAGEG